MDILCYYYSSDWETIELYPVNDVHGGDPNLDEKMFDHFLAYILEKENRLIISAGDNINNALKSSVSNVYNESMRPNEQRRWLVEKLTPVKDRILVMIDGNHEYRSKRDVDMSPVEWMADKLGVPYRENEAGLKITFGKDSHAGRIAYGVYIVHGNGGGKYIGGALNNLENLALTIEGADIVVMGHVHKMAASRPAVRVMDLYHNTVREREKLCVISSHWSNFGGYAARKMLRPSAKGSVPITLSGRRKEARATI